MLDGPTSRCCHCPNLEIQNRLVSRISEASRSADEKEDTRLQFRRQSQGREPHIESTTIILTGRSPSWLAFQTHWLPWCRSKTTTATKIARISICSVLCSRFRHINARQARRQQFRRQNSNDATQNNSIPTVFDLSLQPFKKLCWTVLLDQSSTEH